MNRRPPTALLSLGEESAATRIGDLIARGEAKLQRLARANLIARAEMKRAIAEGRKINPTQFSANSKESGGVIVARVKMSPAELEHAARLFGEGHNCTRIGQQLKRSPNTIRAALERAGLWRKTQ